MTKESIFEFEFLNAALKDDRLKTTEFVLLADEYISSNKEVITALRDLYTTFDPLLAGGLRSFPTFMLEHSRFKNDYVKVENIKQHTTGEKVVIDLDSMLESLKGIAALPLNGLSNKGLIARLRVLKDKAPLVDQGLFNSIFFEVLAVEDTATLFRDKYCPYATKWIKALPREGKKATKSSKVVIPVGTVSITESYINSVNKAVLKSRFENGISLRILRDIDLSMPFTKPPESRGELKNTDLVSHFKNGSVDLRKCLSQRIKNPFSSKRAGALIAALILDPLVVTPLVTIFYGIENSTLKVGVVDGLGRLTDCQEFLKDQEGIDTFTGIPAIDSFIEKNGKCYFSNLPLFLQERLLNAKLPVSVLVFDGKPNQIRVVEQYMFNTLNGVGKPVTTKQLVLHTIENCVKRFESLDNFHSLDELDIYYMVAFGYFPKESLTLVETKNGNSLLLLPQILERELVNFDQSFLDGKERIDNFDKYESTAQSIITALKTAPIEGLKDIFSFENGKFSYNKSMFLPLLFLGVDSLEFNLASLEGFREYIRTVSPEKFNTLAKACRAKHQIDLNIEKVFINTPINSKGYFFSRVFLMQEYIKKNRGTLEGIEEGIQRDLASVLEGIHAEIEKLVIPVETPVETVETPVVETVETR